MARVIQVQEGAQVISRTSSEDMSSANGLCVKLDAAGTVGIADSATADLIIGICVDGGAASGDLVSICVMGMCKALAGTAINEYEAMTCTTGGRVIDTTTPGNYLVGQAMEAAASGDYFDVLVGGGHVRYAATS